MERRASGPGPSSASGGLQCATCSVAMRRSRLHHLQPPSALGRYWTDGAMLSPLSPSDDRPSSETRACHPRESCRGDTSNVNASAGSGHPGNHHRRAGETEAEDTSVQTLAVGDNPLLKPSCVSLADRPKGSLSDLDGVYRRRTYHMRLSTALNSGFAVAPGPYQHSPAIRSRTDPSDQEDVHFPRAPEPGHTGCCHSKSCARVGSIRSSTRSRSCLILPDAPARAEPTFTCTVTVDARHGTPRADRQQMPASHKRRQAVECLRGRGTAKTPATCAHRRGGEP